MFRWAILGTGPVSRTFLLGLKACGSATSVIAVASRTRSNAERFATECTVPIVAESYDDAVALPEVDAVYIATPPSEHKAHALAAIASGKPVLIEKPFAVDAASAKDIVDAARARRVFCMEGMWSRFLPVIQAVRSRLLAGEIGEIRGFRAEFCGPIRPDIKASNFDPARGGGALMHRGVYAVSLARHLVGPIADVKATALIGETGVDEDCSLVMTHDSGAISTARVSLRTMGTNDAVVYGTKGLLYVNRPLVSPPSARIVHYPVSEGGGKGGGRLDRLLTGGFGQGLKQRLDFLIQVLRSTKGERIVSRYRGNGFHYEAESLMQAVADGKTESEIMPLQESLDVMTALDNARASWERSVRP